MDQKNTQKRLVVSALTVWPRPKPPEALTLHWWRPWDVDRPDEEAVPTLHEEIRVVGVPSKNQQEI